MLYVYYIDNEKFTTDNKDEIPWYTISSPNQETPSLEVLEFSKNSYKSFMKVWVLKKFIRHRLTGPARVFSSGIEQFWLNDKLYENVHSWLKAHPNPDLYFHKIGIFTETDKILWYLQN
jgi:hypothetical protein